MPDTIRNSLRFTIFVLILASSLATHRPSQAQTVDSSISNQIGTYIDSRFEAKPGATQTLLAELKSSGLVEMVDLETALRSARGDIEPNADLVGEYSVHDVACYHVDYESKFVLFVPKNFDWDKPAPLVVVGHGGNSSMSPERAQSTASMYLKLYAPAMSKSLGAIVVAPVSGRGWGQIGNSLIFSTVSKLQRMFPIDPDKIYVTGQSMGGHLAFRSALSLPDRWGAVSPQSGGYDFVAKESIGNLINVPGYAIWGVREPYGINTDNRTNQAWAESHGLDWKFVEKNGGHTIYQDELPKVAEFFESHPRNLYRDSVYVRQGGAMKFEKTWQIKGWPEHEVASETRPLRWNLRHWLQIEPRPDIEEPLSALAINRGNNQFEITSENIRQASIFVHPKMIDFEKPVSVVVNGQELYGKRVEPDPELMFELVKEFDDRGRIFWGRIDLEIPTDKPVELPEK